AVVLVATIRALKLHGGVAYADLEKSDPAAVERGLANLGKHIDNIRHFSRTPIVALNRFHTDDEAEIAVVRAYAEKHETPFAVSNHFAEGGKGAIDLAKLLIDSCAQPA